MAAVSNGLPALPAAPHALIRLANINACLRFKGRISFKWAFKGKIGFFVQYSFNCRLFNVIKRNESDLNEQVLKIVLFPDCTVRASAPVAVALPVQR
jgi:hypothetical protein